MRPLVALLVCIFFIGGTALFTRERVTGGGFSGPPLSPTDEKITLEIVPTFAVEADPFALKGEAEETAPALTAAVNGARVLKVEGPLEAGAAVRLSPLPGLVQGVNEVFVEASPPSGREGRVAGLRIRLIRGDEIREEKAFWSDHSEKVSGSFSFTLRESAPGKPHVHDR
jgi:hypothetical protein